IVRNQKPDRPHGYLLARSRGYRLVHRCRIGSKPAPLEQRRLELVAQDGVDAGMAGLPRTDEQPDLEAPLPGGPAARCDDAAGVRADSVGQAALVRQRAYQLPEQVLVAELERERHLSSILGDAASVLPPRTSESCPTSGQSRGSRGAVGRSL